MRLGAILSGLHDAGVECVVVGGLAANVHGSARITADVDVCYDPAPDNRDRLARLLQAWHAHLRGVEPGLPFTLDARTLRDCPVLTLVTDLGDLDVMDRLAGVGEYPAVHAASVEADLAGVPANVLTLDALIAAKRATGRRKDQEALLELEALREERRRRRM
jgi:hypothetical protein